MIEHSRFDGRLYRALNPIWAEQPLSGEGAARFGGRFNAIGTPALYCSLSPLTALREANQAGDLQPTVLVAYDAAIERVFDGRDSGALAGAGIAPDELAVTDWRESMRGAKLTPTQNFARRLSGEGWNALLIRSFARGASQDDLNLVLWRWGDKPPSRMTLIDHEVRLTPRASRRGR
ncbi:MAG: RES domain-containing protein [Novosphingobium sp.]|nr:RES domain-containing protein [Novosphingobium sp.]